MLLQARYGFIAEIPIPRDIPLPLPADRVILEAVVVLVFMAHILFVNLMVGASILAVVFEVLGLKRKDYDTLARKITDTITVNKSLAVVLGVAPLLVVNVLYTVFFYTANALTGTAWISVVPLVAIAFLLGYAHKYSWDRLSRSKGLHIAIGAGAAMLFLIIPFIFLANINLMLFPGKWSEVHGFVSTLLIPNVLPRYAHFLMASFAITALFLLAYLTRRRFPVESVFKEFDRDRLRRMMYSLAFAATAAQLVIGPWLLFTLPVDGLTGYFITVILIAAGLALVALILMWREILASPGVIGRRYGITVGLITFTALTMGYGRHLYREGALRDHRQLMAIKSRDYEWAIRQAELREAQGALLSGEDGGNIGRHVFESTCSGCHAADRVLVGPSIQTIADIYADNAAGIVSWTRKPGRKRAEMPPMPAFPLGDEKLNAVARYMLQLAGKDGEPRTSTAPEASGG